MGEEISHTAFSAQDFRRFKHNLDMETRHVSDLFNQDPFSRNSMIGIELEAWMLDPHMQPAPNNEAYIDSIQHPQIVPELAKFNIEFNSNPHPLQGHVLQDLHREMALLWQHAHDHANAEHDNHLLMVGILPTLEAQQLSLANMSPLSRYHALNEQIWNQRQGRPIDLEILGREHIQRQQYNVMLEAATTSLQIHLQVNLDNAKRMYNAALITAAPLVAISANSPFLFGRDLWDETRIPVFEQAIGLGGYAATMRGPLRRVGLGSDYIQHSLFECFQENLQHYPPLLPLCQDSATEDLQHLRLHNGTIWRWVRPIIDTNGTEPHLRIEQRIVASGPSLVDSIANVAFFLGLTQALGQQNCIPEHGLPFSQCRDNFYQAARYGMNAQVTWWNGERYKLRRLLGQQLLPAAHEGLQSLGLDRSDIDYYLAIIQARIQRGRNGATWQRAFVAKHGADMSRLTQTYHRYQRSGLPVHSWAV